MARIIIGITGLMASGKGAAAKYYEEKYHASNNRFSTMLRDALDRFYLPHTRENMVAMSEAMREKFGQDIMAKVIAEDAKNDANDLVVIEGIRRIPDITHLAKLPNFILVKIEAKPETRYSRLTQRGENEDDSGKTYEQFILDHQLPTEMTIPEVMNLATVSISNEGDFTELHEQLDKLITNK
jgi:dephospho-CoA kinase